MLRQRSSCRYRQSLPTALHTRIELMCAHRRYSRGTKAVVMALLKVGLVSLAVDMAQPYWPESVSKDAAF